MELTVYLCIRLVLLLPGPVYRKAARVVTRSVCALLFLTGRARFANRLLHNVARVTPGTGIRGQKAVIRRLMEEIILNGREAARMGRDRRLDRSIRVVGLEHLRAALDRKRGVILLSAHLGNFPLVLYVLGRRNIPIANIGRDPSNRYLGRDFVRVRRRAGIVTIPQKPAARSSREGLRWLKRGGALSLLADQYASRGTDASFFGYRRGTPVGPAVLSRRLRCPVVPVFITRENGKHLVRIHPALDLSFSNRPDEDIRVNSARFNQVMEAAIRRHPGQWLTLITRRFR